MKWHTFPESWHNSKLTCIWWAFLYQFLSTAREKWSIFRVCPQSFLGLWLNNEANTNVSKAMHDSFSLSDLLDWSRTKHFVIWISYLKGIYLLFLDRSWTDLMFSGICTLLLQNLEYEHTMPDISVRGTRREASFQQLTRQRSRVAKGRILLRDI
jgi:hypothetical protein